MTELFVTRRDQRNSPKTAPGGESADDTGKNAFGSSDSSSESNRSVRSFRVVSCDVDKRLYREDLLQRRRMIPGRPSFEDSA